MEKFRIQLCAFLCVIMMASCGDDSNDMNLDNDDNENGTLEAPVGAEIVADLAGTYTVTETTAGEHTRGTVTIGADAAIDFDSNVSFTSEDIAVGNVFDRLECCNRISVNYDEDDDGRSIRLYVDDSGVLIRVQYSLSNEDVNIEVNVE
ncbi:MAG: hypothetical protein RIC35_09445 [Marinoscillum sp.]